MKELSPIPLWFRISDVAKLKLWDYQLKVYDLYLEIPHMPNPEAYSIAPIILDTEQASRLMKMKPKGRGGRP